MQTKHFRRGPKQPFLIPWARRAKANKMSLWARCIEEAHDHTAFQAGGNDKAQVQVGKKGVANTSEKYTIAHSNHVGLHFIRFEMG